MNADAESPRGALNVVVAATFAVAALLFVLHFVYVYTVWENGRLTDVLWGLWGLYFPAILALGAWRARPRPGRSGLFYAVLMLAFVQAFLYAVGFGATVFLGPNDKMPKAASYGLVAAVFAAPLLGIAMLFLVRRRGWRIGWLATGELGGALTLAAYFLLLN